MSKTLFTFLLSELKTVRILCREKKCGGIFELPIDAWLRGPLAEMFEAAVLAPQARVRDFIDQAAARNLQRAHRSRAGRHGGVLWSLLVLARWAERHLGAPAPSSQVGVTA